MEKDVFADLDKVKIGILKEKICAGIQSFEENSKRQWTEIRFERPLLEKMLELIDKE